MCVTSMDALARSMLSCLNLRIITYAVLSAYWLCTACAMPNMPKMSKTLNTVASTNQSMSQDCFIQYLENVNMMLLIHLACNACSEMLQNPVASRLNQRHKRVFDTIVVQY